MIPARDGRKIPVYLTKPPDVEAPPLVMLPHGGPAARDSMEFDWWASFLASRGYAVAQPNFRGSAGYGVDWQEAGYREWGHVMQDDVDDTLHALRSAGLVHPEKACIVGASYGGYAALMGGTRNPDLYQCVASFAGVSDLPHMLHGVRVRQGKFSGGADWWRMLIGDYEKERSWLESISPAYNAASAKAPFLIVHGKLDTIVPITQSERMVSALRKHDISVDYQVFPGEDHWLSDAGTRTKWLELLDVFLSKHIGNNSG